MHARAQFFQAHGVHIALETMPEARAVLILWPTTEIPLQDPNVRKWLAFLSFAGSAEYQALSTRWSVRSEQRVSAVSLGI